MTYFFRGYLSSMGNPCTSFLRTHVAIPIVQVAFHLNAGKSSGVLSELGNKVLKRCQFHLPFLVLLFNFIVDSFVHRRLLMHSILFYNDEFVVLLDS
jgi:hypothetical protein